MNATGQCMSSSALVLSAAAFTSDQAGLEQPCGSRVVEQLDRPSSCSDRSCRQSG